MLRHDDHVVDYVDDYLHELLNETDAQYVQEHYQKCAICRTAMEEAERRLGMLQSVAPVEPSDRLIHRTVLHVANAGLRRTTIRRAAWRICVTSLAAAILIVASLHIYFANAQPTAYDLTVLAQPQMMPGTQGSLRAIVSRGDTGHAVSGANVQVDLRDPKTSRQAQLVSFNTNSQGSSEPRFQLPDWADGDYELRITAYPGRGSEVITRPLKLQRDWKLMLSTDKPVYQPGQTIHLRALALRQPDLKPIAGNEATFSITDPKGNVIFKSKSVTSRYGISSADCSLADEITEGAYAIQCTVADTQSKSTVEVKKYVLPKFHVEVEAEKPYYEPGARIKLWIRAGYFFGKPVAGASVEADLRSDVGGDHQVAQTDEHGTANLEFSIPTKLIGKPEDSGDARVAIDLLVRDTGGQEQRKSISRVVTANPLRVELIPESGELTQNVANQFYVLTTHADGRAANARVAVSGLDHELSTGELGATSFELTPHSSQFTLTVRATDDQGLSISRQVELKCGQATNDFVLRTDKAVYRGGQAMTITVLSAGNEPVFIDLVKDGQTLLTQTVAVSNGHGQHQIDLPPDVFGTLQVNAYRIGSFALAARKSRLVYVEPAQGLKIQVAQNQTEYRPGDSARLSFTLTDASGKPAAGALSLAAVDEAVFSVLDQAPGMERTFFTLEQSLLKPIYAIYNWSPDLASSASSDQQAELERALFSRASETAPETPNDARAALQRMVDAGELDRQALDVLNRPDVDQLMDNTGLDEPIRSMILKAKGAVPSLSSTFPGKAERFEIERQQRLEQIQVAWTLIGIVAFIAFLVWLVRVFGEPVITVLVVLMIIALLVSMLLPSLNRARETSNRVKAASNLRQMGQAILLDQNEHKLGQAQAPAATNDSLSPRIRQWFPETLLWRPELITDDQGHASLDVPLADSITTWRLSTSAVSADGRLGATQSGIRVFQPFFVDLNLPVALTRNDEIAIPAVVYNYLDRAQTVELTLDKQGDWFELLDEPIKRIDLQAGEVRSVSYRLRVKRVGLHDLQITARGGTIADAIKRTVEVVPDGHRIESVTNGTLQQPAQVKLALPPGAIEGSASLIVKIYPSSFSQLVEGLDGIFQRPYGCFEQTSSTTYPNILALTYLKQTNKSVPDVEARAREYIHLGYQRLVGFEVPGGGFDWFGRPAASVVLTAYGLMEFEDMRQVYDVDPILIARTRQWLISQRRSDGSWSAGSMLHDGLADTVVRGTDPDLATTAYVAWSVFGSGQNRESAGQTLDYLRRHAVDQIDDPYVLAMLANAFLAIDPNSSDASRALERLAQLRRVSTDGKLIWWDQPQGARTAFFGAGASGSIETTSLATLAMIRAGRDPGMVRSALAWIITQKDSLGTWPSTQATVLALKALLSGTGKPLGGDAARNIQLSLNDDFSKQINISTDQAEVMQQINLSDHLRTGKNTVVLREQTGAASGYQIDFHYHEHGAEPSRASDPLAITLDYDRADLSVGQTMTATASVTNRMRQTAPMILVDLPIPPGFEVEVGDLNTMVSRGSAAKYQLTPRSAVIYLRSLQPGQTLELRYRLDATTPVKVTAPPAKVYEYYDPSKHAESAPKSLTVTQAS